MLEKAHFRTLHVKFYPFTPRGVLGKGFNAVIQGKSLSAEFFSTLFRFLGYKVLESKARVHFSGKFTI